MVAIFVRHHVVARKIAARAHLPGHLVIEAGVDVDALVGRAVERPHRTGGIAATRCRAAGVVEQRRLFERHAGFGKQRFPCLVQRGQRVAAFHRIGVVVADLQGALVSRCRGLLLLAARLLRAFYQPDHLPGVHAEYQRADQHHHQAAAAKAAGTAHPGAATAAAAPYADRSRIELVEPH